MSAKTPFFSILLPTRNRADMLVESALRSVLNSSFEDYEVVICDNASTDNTPERVKEIKDPRVRYVKSSTWIPKELFFEFAFKQARGEFSLIFCDDDYLTVDGLQKAFNVLSKYETDMLIFPPSCTYYFPDWYEISRKNVLTIPLFDRRVYKYYSSSHLQAIFERISLLSESPMVTDVFYKTSFVKSLIKKYRTLFPYGHMGDFNIAVYTLLNTPFFLFLNQPLVVFGHWSNNTTEQLYFMKTTMPEYRDWIRWFTQTYLSKMPVKTYQWKNCIAACLLDMKEKLHLPLEISIVTYMYCLAEELMFLEVRGTDVYKQKQECRKVFASLPFDIKQEILRVINEGIRFKIYPECEILSDGPIRHLSSNKSEGIGCLELRINGGTYNFNNVFEAGRFFDGLLAGKQKLKAEGVRPSTSEATEIMNDYIAGLSIIGKTFNRICLLGNNNNLTKAAAMKLNQKLYSIVDLNPLLQGFELATGVIIKDTKILLEGDFDCIVLTTVDRKLGDDVPYPFLSDYLKSVIKKGKSNNAVVIRSEDVFHLGSICRSIAKGDLDIYMFLRGLLDEGKKLTDQGRCDLAYELFTGVLNAMRGLTPIVMKEIEEMGSNSMILKETEKTIAEAGV